MTSTFNFLVRGVIFVGVMQCGYISASHFLPSTCAECTTNNLRFYVASSEQWTLIRTENSVEVIGDSETNGTVTGGAIGPDLFRFSKFQFEWSTSNGIIIFEVKVYFFNTKYWTFDNSLNYPNGAIVVTIPITLGSVSNTLFDKFAKSLECLKKPGDSVAVESSVSYIWFKNFPVQTSYKYYTISYYNKQNGKTYPCVTAIDLQIEKNGNFISHEQFQETFGKMQNAAGTLPQNKPTSLPRIGFGIKSITVV